MADLLETSAATVSRIENGEAPYSQDYLEAAAAVLGCEPQDLLSRDPSAPQPVLEVWNRILPSDQPRALDVLSRFAPPIDAGPEEARPRRAKRG